MLCYNTSKFGIEFAMSALLADLFELAGLNPVGRLGTTLPILWRRIEWIRVPRLKFFIHVDAVALESCKNEGREMRFELDPTKYRYVK
jgi:hypothetical protein